MSQTQESYEQNEFLHEIKCRRKAKSSECELKLSQIKERISEDSLELEEDCEELIKAVKAIKSKVKVKK